MSKYNIEIVISTGDSPDGTNWVTVADTVVLRNNTLDSLKEGQVDLQMQVAILKAAQLIRDELGDK